MTAYRPVGIATPLFILTIFATILLSGLECRAQSGADYVGEPDCNADKRSVPKGEKTCLRQLGDVASRQGNTLTLKLSNRKIKKYESNTAACEGEQVNAEKCIVFSLAGFFRSHQTYLVRYGLYEGDGWTLVRRSDGSETEIDAAPHFSPDGRRFAIIAASESGGANRVDIWHMPENGPPKLEFRYDVPANHYELHDFRGWDGNDSMRATVTMRLGGELVTAALAVVRTDGSWTKTSPKIEADK